MNQYDAIVPTSINNKGVVGGRLGNQATVWNQNGSYTFLTDFNGSNYGMVYGVNLNGIVAGGATETSSLLPSIWIDKSSPINPFEPDINPGVFYAVSDNGLAVGFIDVGSETAAFTYLNGQLSFLIDPLGHSSVAYGLNNQGIIVGESYWGERRAVVWNNGVGTVLPYLDGYYATIAYRINDSGLIIGESGGRGVTWKDGELTYLAPPGSYFAGINNAGTIIGAMNQAPVIFENGTIRNIYSSIHTSATLSSLRLMDINDTGMITGYGIIDGQLNAFVLTPVPEPSTLALTAIALLAILAKTKANQSQQ